MSEVQRSSAFYGEGDSAPWIPDRTEGVFDVLTHLSGYGLLGQIEILERALTIAVAARDVGKAVPENTFVACGMDTNRN
jgi:hypothetical protein